MTTAPCTERASCTDDTGNRTDGTGSANAAGLLADIQRELISPGSLIVADEGSMISIAHLAAIGVPLRRENVDDPCSVSAGQASGAALGS